jgi:hypothetical protein
MFGEHLPKWLDKRQGETNRIVFYAHGGLTSEADGLWIAYQQLEWWKANGVYPIHFVWETGFLETLKQLLARSGREVPRAFRGISGILHWIRPLRPFAMRSAG